MASPESSDSMAAAATTLEGDSTAMPSSKGQARMDDSEPSPERIRSLSPQPHPSSRAGSRAGSKASRSGSEGLLGKRSRSNTPGTPCSRVSSWTARSTSRNRPAAEPISPSRQRFRTAIAIDWDDTLFPTTWLLEDAEVSCHKPIDEQMPHCERSDVIKALMRQFSYQVEHFLKEASAGALVFIVTLAKTDWVERSIRYFMPGLVGHLENCSIRVIYASEYLHPDLKMRAAKDGKPAAIDASDERLQRYIEAKADAMFSVLAESGTLNSFISIGDSDIERQGSAVASDQYAQMLRSDNPNSGDAIDRAPPLKTMKLLNEPTVEELKAQVMMLRRWLPYLVDEKDELHLEIESSEEDSALVELHKMITGQDEDLSWTSLAGLDDDGPSMNGSLTFG